MGIKFSNNGSTTLNGGIDSSQETIIVDATASFPTIGNGSSNGDYFYATLIAQDGTREVIKAIFLTGSTYTVTRAQDGTSGAAFSDEDRFQLRFPKIILEEFRDDIDVNTTDLAGTTNAITVPAPAGTIMWFYQDTPPATWTIYTTVEDCLLAVKASSGHFASNIGDGVEAGSEWNAVFAHVHTMNSHVHTMTNHKHTYAHWHVENTSHSHTGPSHSHTGPSHNHTITHTHTYSGTTSVEDKPNGEQGSGSNNLAREEHVHTFSGTTSGSSAANSGSSGTGSTGAAGTGATGTESITTGYGIDTGGLEDDTSTVNLGNSSSVDPGDTNSTTQPSADRPRSAVGILAEKD
jgi:hypothetical protein